MPQKSLLSWAGYSFDAVTSTSTQDQVVLTQHPLEDGGLVTDHIRAMPTPVSADVVISDIPGDGTQYTPGRSDTMYQALLRELAQGTVADLVTGSRAHRDMVLTSVSRTRSAPEAAARLALRWDPVRKAASFEVAVPREYTTAAAASAVSVGKKETVSPPPAEIQTRARSILRSLVGG